MIFHDAVGQLFHSLVQAGQKGSEFKRHAGVFLCQALGIQNTQLDVTHGDSRGGANVPLQKKRSHTADKTAVADTDDGNGARIILFDDIDDTLQYHPDPTAMLSLFYDMLVVEKILLIDDVHVVHERALDDGGFRKQPFHIGSFVGGRGRSDFLDLTVIQKLHAFKDDSHSAFVDSLVGQYGLSREFKGSTNPTEKGVEGIEPLNISVLGIDRISLYKIDKPRIRCITVDQTENTRAAA